MSKHKARRMVRGDWLVRVRCGGEIGTPIRCSGFGDLIWNAQTYAR
jgi:hypothetical protein